MRFTNYTLIGLNFTPLPVEGTLEEMGEVPPMTFFLILVGGFELLVIATVMKGTGMTKGRARALFAMMLAIVLGACSLIGLSGCSSASSPTGSDTLRVGVRADIVNFGYLNEQTGKYYGMEIDLANEMANRLGYSNVELVTVLPDNRKEMLLNGEVDCLVACYSKTDTRL